MKKIGILRGVFLIILTLVFPNAFAQKSETLESTAKFPTQLSEQDKKRWNLQDVDIHNIIEQVAKETGKNFIVDPKVQGRASVISTHAMDSEELYQVFLSILQVLGFAAVPTGDVIKIVPDASAKFLPAPLVGESQNRMEPADAVVVRVIPVQNGNATALIPVLRNLTSPQGHLAAYAPSNAVIVADTAANVERLAAIIQKMDLEDTDGMEIVHLEHASASEVVNSLTSMLNKPGTAQPGGGSQLAVTADDRSNSLIIAGDKKRRQQVKNLVARLDVPVDGEGNTEVVYLHYQKAEDMVPVLGNILSSYYGGNAAQANAGTFRPPSPSGNRQNQQRKPPSWSSNMSSDFPTRQPESGSSYFGGDAPYDAVSKERQATGTVIGGYGVQAEPNTNALIITAPPSLMRNLKAVVAKLDIRRAQVVVEAIIAEVSELRNLELGIEWRGERGSDLVGGTKFSHDGIDPLDRLQAALNPADLPIGFTPPLAAAGLTVGIIKGESITAVLHALQSDNNANILMTPNLMALDNTEAEIRVGDTVPFPIGEYATTGGVNTVTPFVTNEYREVGLELRLTPQITKGNAIRLAIDLKADALGVPEADGDPTIINRSVSTSVQVNDSEIIVLGGLIRTQENKNLDKIPILGDIPLIGYAFRGFTRGTRKTNLMIFLRPTILREEADNMRVTNSKYDFIREQQIWARADADAKEREQEGVLVPWKTIKNREINIPEPFNLEN